MTEHEIDNLDQLTDAELVEYERLLLEQGLYELDEFTNTNYKLLYEAVTGQDYDIRGELKDNCWAGAILEGSSRSGKTWAGIDLIIFICLFVETDCKINIYREFFADFKDTLYDDFRRRLDDFGIPNKFKTAEIVKSFKINGSTISFKGCDKVGSKHGAGADYVFFNEMMHIPQAIFKQATVRCRKFWWGDYNPSVTQHWVFDSVLTRSDVAFLRTTFLDNQHISNAERNEILVTEPWKPGSYKVKGDTIYYRGQPVTEQHQPPPHHTNIENGTADEFFWKVYGLGLRGAMKGVIFKHVNYIDEWPEDVAHTYGMDFGFTVDPSTLVKYGETETDIYMDLKLYNPTESAELMHECLVALGIEENVQITADSSDKYTAENKGTVEMVKDLKRKGWKIKKVKKTKSVMYWIGSMKKKRINIIKGLLYRKFKKEQENYRMKVINGTPINQPIDKWNHAWDGGRYGHIEHNSEDETYITTKSPRQLGINH